MDRKRVIQALTIGLIALSTPKIVDSGLEMVARAEAKEQKKSIDAKALELIDNFDENGTYANLQSGKYDQVLRDYQDDADVLMRYDLDSLQGERRRVAGVMFDNVGYAFKNKKLYEDAITYAKMASIFIPNSTSPHNTMGFCYVKLQQWENALNEYMISKDLCNTQECVDSVTPIIVKIEKILKR